MRMLRVHMLMIVIFGGLMGCNQTAAPVQSIQPAASKPKLLDSGSFKSYELNERQIEVVKTAVRSELKDPQSAIFSIMDAGINSEDTIMVCGLVNAKNSYGGYTGDTVYSAVITANSAFGKALIGKPGSSSMLQVCQRQNLLL